MERSNKQIGWHACATWLNKACEIAVITMRWEIGGLYVGRYVVLVGPDCSVLITTGETDEPERAHRAAKKLWDEQRHSKLDFDIWEFGASVFVSPYY